MIYHKSGKQRRMKSWGKPLLESEIKMHKRKWPAWKHGYWEYLTILTKNM